MRPTQLTISLIIIGCIAACAGNPSDENPTNEVEQNIDTLASRPDIVEPIETIEADVEPIAEPVVETKNDNQVPLVFVDPALQNSEKIVDFRYRGRIINPFILEEFVKFAVSDRYSSIREVDLTIGNASNRYFFDTGRLYAEKRGDLKYIVYPERENNEDNRMYLQYAYLGKLKNGIHVVILEEIQMTSSDYKTLLGIRFTTEKVHYDDKPHVFIKCVKTESINQYVKYKIDPDSNRVQVIPIGNQSQADFSDLEIKAYWVSF
jgi:hypothetical protein